MTPEQKEKRLAAGRLRNKRYREANAAKIRERTKAWRAANRDKTLEYSRRHNAKNPRKPQTRQRIQRYGLSQEAYDQMLTAQDHACAICEAPTWEHQKRLHVDHDHATGVVRGLLCSPCNMALGGFRDSPKLLANAIRYIERIKTDARPETEQPEDRVPIEYRTVQ